MAEENAFVKALAAAQAEMDNAAFDKTNPHFKSKYASLAAVRDACQAILNKHGFAVISTVEFSIHGQCMQKTELAHVSGESRFSYWPIGEGTTQQKGSDNSYGRRYGLSGLAGIASEEDDDGNISAGKPKSAYQGRKEGFYPIAQQAIRDCQTLTELKNWWVKNYEQIQAMPPQWIPLLEEEKDRRKLELADELEPANGALKMPLKEALERSLAQTIKHDLVPNLTAEEAAEIDDVLTSDPHAYLTNLDGDLATAQNDGDLMEIWAEHQGIKEVLGPKDRDQAQLIYEKHSRRLKAEAGVKAFKAGKK